MKALLIGTAATVALAVSSAAFADVTLTIRDGRVSLVARDATVRQILTEWARIGQTTIINVDRIPGGPQTIELTNVPESEALEILLRSISGYMAAPRAAAASVPSSVSQFDRIVVMPTVAAPKPPPSAAAPAQPVVFAQPQLPQPAGDEPEDGQPVGMPAGAQRGPIFNQFPAPQAANPQPGYQVVNPATGQAMPAGVPQPFNPAQPFQPAAPPQVQQQPSSVPTAPFGGVAVPGMVVPAPQVPGQPAAPGQVVQPGVVQPGVVQPGIVQPQPAVIPSGPPRRQGGIGEPRS